MVCCSPVDSAEPNAPAPVAKDVFFVIPHTHWEGAVFLTREEYLDVGLPNILRALRLLKAHPNYRFVLDQACYVKPFLERYPEEEAAFRKFIKEGRLAIVGGTDVMLDVNMPGGESFVRQVLYGKGYFRQKLGRGRDRRLATRHLRASRADAAVVEAGRLQVVLVLSRRGRLENPVGVSLGRDRRLADSRLLAAARLRPGCTDRQTRCREFSDFFKEQFNALAPFARGRGRVGLEGADVSEPEEHLPALVEQFNRQPNAPFELRLAVPGDFEALVAKRRDRPVIGGELNPIFQGTYSSRIELKQRTRELEALLTTAEKLGVLQHWLAPPTDDEILWRAWEPMLFNQTHDLMSGVMTEHVYQDVVRGYDFSKRIANDEVQSRLRSVSAAIDSEGEGVPVAVFNMLGWPRTDLAIANVGFSDSKVMDVKVIGPDGASVPVQLLDSDRSGDGGLLRARIAFVARDVPAMGYSVYRVLPSAAAAAPAAKPGDASVLENDDYRIEFDPAGGAIVRLLVKKDNWEALRARATSWPAKRTAAISGSRTIRSTAAAASP